MRASEFNKKYKDYIEVGFEEQGLEFDIPQVTKWLDNIFQDLILIPDFTYAQIKIKFGMARFYTTLKSVQLTFLIEEKINTLLKQEEQ